MFQLYKKKKKLKKPMLFLQAEMGEYYKKVVCKLQLKSFSLLNQNKHAIRDFEKAGLIQKQVWHSSYCLCKVHVHQFEKNIVATWTGMRFSNDGVRVQDLL